MVSRITMLVALCIIGLASAVPESYTYLVPEQGSDAKTGQTQGEISYEYQIVPSSEYAVAEQSSELSIMDLILSPITALSSVCSTALSVMSWVFSNGLFVFLGMAIVIGFCALTPYCTLTIEQDFTKKLRSSASYIPYLDDVESFFMDAYHKYSDMQNIQ